MRWLLLVAVTVTACTSLMDHPGEIKSEVYLDAEDCISHTQDYARRAIGNRIAAYKVCMMEKGYMPQ